MHDSNPGLFGHISSIVYDFRHDFRTNFGSQAKFWELGPEDTSSWALKSACSEGVEVS